MRGHAVRTSLRLAPQKRARIKAPRGTRLWTKPEIDIVLKYYPNFEKMTDLLPHRTERACRNKWYESTSKRIINPWTGAELMVLRRLYPHADREYLIKSLPKRSVYAIHSRACLLKIRRPLPKFRLCGVCIIDDIKLRARKMNYTMKELDAETGSNDYFRSVSLSGYVRIRSILSALELLGGRIEIIWKE